MEPQTSPANPRWWLPSISQWLWLMIVLLLLTNAWRTVLVSADGDACFHWQTGEVMLRTGRIIDADPFSHTRFAAPMLSKEWLAQVVFAIGGRWGGLTGVSLVGALLIATTLALLHRQLIREGSDALTATLLTVLAMWTSTTHWLARPHAFSFVLIVLWHGVVRDCVRTRRFKPLALWLPGLTLVWVNLHGAYLTGFFILGAYWLGAFLTKDLQQVKHLTLAGMLCGVASLVNPAGWQLHAHNLAFLRGEFFPHWLAEYASTNFQSPGGQGFLLWLAALGVVLVGLRPVTTVAERIMLLMWGYFALYAARNVPLLAFLSAPIIAPAVAAALRGRWPGVCARFDAIPHSPRAWPVVAALAAVAIAVTPLPIEMPRDKFPVEAVAAIRAEPERFAGPMFNQYLWGGYLIAFLPEHKVFVDGRADFYGEELVKEFDRVTALRPGWEEPLEKYGVAWSLMPTAHPLNLALAAAGWELWHRDAVATIYGRPRS